MFNLLVPLIILLPLLGLTVNGLLGYRIGRRGVAVIGWGVVGLSFLLSIVAAVQLNALPPEERHVVVSLWQWVDAGGFHVPVEFYLDPLSALMILIVTGIGFLIHVYSAGYMADDRGYARYFAYLNLFVFSMLVLVLGGNFLLLYMGWELVARARTCSSASGSARLPTPALVARPSLSTVSVTLASPSVSCSSLPSLAALATWTSSPARRACWPRVAWS